MKYFLHDSSSFEDEKISMLFMEYGYEGLGLFYTILEKLAKQEKPINTRVLKMQLKVGKKLEKCWKFMEEIEILSSNNGETFNKRLLKFNESVDKTRERKSKWISEQRNNEQDTKNVDDYETSTGRSNLTKLNLTKEDTKVSPNEGEVFLPDPFEEKEKEKPKVPPKRVERFNALGVELPHGEHFKSAWINWVKHRAEMKKPLTETSVLQQLKMLSRYEEGMAVNFILQTIEKGWQGLVYEIRSGYTPVSIHPPVATKRATLNDKYQ